MDIDQLKIKTPDNYNWDDIIFILMILMRIH